MDEIFTISRGIKAFLEFIWPVLCVVESVVFLLSISLSCSLEFNLSALKVLMWHCFGSDHPLSDVKKFQNIKWWIFLKSRIHDSHDRICNLWARGERPHFKFILDLIKIELPHSDILSCILLDWVLKKPQEKRNQGWECLQHLAKSGEGAK